MRTLSNATYEFLQIELAKNFIKQFKKDHNNIFLVNGCISKPKDHTIAVYINKAIDISIDYCEKYNYLVIYGLKQESFDKLSTYIL